MKELLDLGKVLCVTVLGRGQGLVTAYANRYVSSCSRAQSSKQVSTLGIQGWAQLSAQDRQLADRAGARRIHSYQVVPVTDGGWL